MKRKLINYKNTNIYFYRSFDNTYLYLVLLKKKTGPPFDHPQTFWSPYKYLDNFITENIKQLLSLTYYLKQTKSKIFGNTFI